VDRISNFWSDNGKREAVVFLRLELDKYYLVELRERGMLKDVKIFSYIEAAEDAAENWVQNK